jgi:hypothetical protein
VLRVLIRADEDPKQMLKLSREIYETSTLEEKKWLLEKYYTYQG